MSRCTELQFKFNLIIQIISKCFDVSCFFNFIQLIGIVFGTFFRVVEKNKEPEPEEVSEENRQYQKVTGIRLTLQRITALIKNKIIFNQKHPLSMIVSVKIRSKINVKYKPKERKSNL